jgi:hypothetical protein
MIPAKANEYTKCLQTIDKKSNKLVIFLGSKPVLDEIILHFSVFFKIDLILKLKINIKTHNKIILNGSRISDNGSIKSLKKVKN